MDLYFLKGQAPTQLPASATDPAGNVWSDLANSKEGREACGFTLAPEPPPFKPDTQTVRWDVDKAKWMVETLPPPAVYEPPAPTPSGPVITYKADVWRRASVDQAKIIDSALKAQDIRMQRLWDDAQYLDHASEEFALLKEKMLEAFGEEVASTILAPSAS